MRVHFAATLDDMVDAHLRAQARSRVAQSWHWEGFVSVLLLAGPLLLAIALEERAARVGIAILAIVLYAGTLRSIGGWYIKRFLRKFFQEQLGDEAPFEVTVEVSPSGVSVRELGLHWDHQWSNIERILQTSDSVDFHARHGAIVVVRKRAFDSPDSMRQFVELAERFRADAQKPGS